MKIIYKKFAYVKNYSYLCYVKNKGIKVLIRYYIVIIL